jgi:hypothetical protein
MNCQSDSHIDEDSLSLDSLRLSPLCVNEAKPKRGRPPKPDAKDEKGRYICNLKCGKKYYEENREKMIEKSKKYYEENREKMIEKSKENTKENYKKNPLKLIERSKEIQKKYREGFHTLEELITKYNIQIPSEMKEKVNKLYCF